VRLLKKGLRVITPDGPEFWDRPFWEPPFLGPPPAWLLGGDNNVRVMLILMWAMPGGWAGQTTNTRHALFSADGWGCLSFDNTKRGAIRFDGTDGQELVAPVQLNAGELLVAALATRHNLVNLAASKSAIYVAAGPGNSGSRTRNSRPAARLTVPLLPHQGATWLGSYRGESQIWNGHIRSIKIIPAWLSPKVWRDHRPSFCTDVGKPEDAIRRFSA